MANLVTIRSKRTRKGGEIVVYDTVKVTVNGIEQERELSTMYVFKNYEASIPLEHANILVRNQPTNFSIVEDENYKKLTKTNKEVADSTNKMQEDYETWQKCPVCEKTGFKNKAGFTSHFRLKHLEEYKLWKKKQF